MWDKKNGFLTTELYIQGREHLWKNKPIYIYILSESKFKTILYSLKITINWIFYINKVLLSLIFYQKFLKRMLGFEGGGETFKQKMYIFSNLCHYHRQTTHRPTLLMKSLRKLLLSFPYIVCSFMILKFARL